MAVNYHSGNYNNNRRSCMGDSVGILMDGELVFQSVEYWIKHNPLNLWEALYDKVHKLSLTHDAYELLKATIAHHHPEVVGELLKRKNKYALLKQIRSKFYDAKV